MSVTRLEVLRLYKNLLTYSRKLTLTDPAYFRRRIITEFKNNKSLSNERRIATTPGLRRLTMILLKRINLFRPSLSTLQTTVYSKKIDFSKVPKISENDLEEKFVRGGGPGGSAVNKNANCVVLTHTPTGTVVKCHISRCQDENRKLARELLVAKLDDMLNGSESVAAQKKRIEENKSKKTEYKKKKLAQLKSEWKKREGLA